MRPHIRHLPTLALLLLLFPACVGAADALRIVATPDVIDDFNRLLAGRHAAELNRAAGEGARREVLELLLVEQALVLGGESRTAELVPAPTYRRMLALVADGHADLTGSSAWGSDIDTMADRLRASAPVVADGESVAGLFHAPRAVLVDERIRAGQWDKLTAVSSRTWTPDWQALQQVGLATVYDVGEWPAMVRMVDAGRADFLLAPFQAGSDASLRQDGVTLVPVAGVCLPLAGSRHIAVARRASTDPVFTALERGLARLRGEDTIHRTYAGAILLATSPRNCRVPAHTP